MKKFDNIKNNKIFLDKMDKFLLDLETDPKIKRLENYNYRVYFVFEFQARLYDGIIITKGDLMDFIRLRFLSVIFTKDYQIL